MFLDNSIKKLNETFNTVYTYLLTEYNLKKEQLTTASPYIQILKFLNYFKNTLLLLLEDSIQENNILTARKRRSIDGHALLTGHNPMRANCAKGNITLSINTTFLSNIEGEYIIIPNNTILKNTNNNLEYSILLHSKQLLVNKNDNTDLNVDVVQGVFKTKTFISTGTELQSFDIASSTRDLFVDNTNVYITVNGSRYNIYQSLWDMNNTTNGVIVRTSLTNGVGGINVIFGNNSFGGVPQKGARITVTYLETSGIYGNLYNDLSSLNFTWESDITDNLGNTLNGEDIFNIVVDNEIAFGTNPESTSFTKLILNKFSQVNVLGNTNSYITYFKRLGLFSYVNAYTKNILTDNTIYIVLIPDFKRKLNYDNYFSLPLSSYYLSVYEKDIYYTKLLNSGKVLPNTHIEIVNPTIKRYILNINLRVFNNIDSNTIKENITNKLSEYFYLVRRSKLIPKSDIIRLVESVDGVDSVNIHFLSEDNENAKNVGYYFKNGNKIPVTNTTNLGLNDFGDIVVNDNDIAIIKGGWYDSNEQYYEEKFTNDNTLCGLNINIVESVTMSTLDELIQSKLKEL